MKWFALFLLLVVAGCETINTSKGVLHIPASVDVRALDLRKYAEKGILVTPYQYTGEYLAIGSISITMYPDLRRRIRHTATSETEYTPWTVTRDWLTTPLDSLVALAVSWGADAVVDLKMDSRINPEASIDALTVSTGAEVSGFAIKRAE